MKLTFNILYLSLLIVLFSGCTNDEKISLDHDFKEYFGIYKNGSWWTYIDTAQNITDSIYVTGYTRQWQSFKDKGGPYYEGIEYNLIGKLKKSTIRVHKDDDPNYYSYFFIDRYLGDKLSSEVFKYTSYCILGLLYNKGNYENIDFNDCYKPADGILRLDTFYIDQTLFEDIIKMWSCKDTIYYAKNIGIIKIYLNDSYNNVDYNLQLKDYQINF